MITYELLLELHRQLRLNTEALSKIKTTDPTYMNLVTQVDALNFAFLELLVEMSLLFPAPYNVLDELKIKTSNDKDDPTI